MTFDLPPYGVNPDTIGPEWDLKFADNPVTPERFLRLIGSTFARLRQVTQTKWHNRYLPARMPWAVYDDNPNRWATNPGQLFLPNAAYTAAAFLATGINPEHVERWFDAYPWNDGELLAEDARNPSIPPNLTAPILTSLEEGNVPPWPLVAPIIVHRAGHPSIAPTFLAWAGEWIRRSWPTGTLNPARTPTPDPTATRLLLVTSPAGRDTRAWWVRSNASLGTLLGQFGVRGPVALQPTTDVGYQLPYGFSVVVGPHSRALSAGVASPSDPVGTVLRPGWSVETLSGKAATGPRVAAQPALLTVHSAYHASNETEIRQDRTMSALTATAAGEDVWPCGGVLPVRLGVTAAVPPEHDTDSEAKHHWWQGSMLRRG